MQPIVSGSVMPLMSVEGCIERHGRYVSVTGIFQLQVWIGLRSLDQFALFTRC
jgi:hypothetical protein